MTRLALFLAATALATPAWAQADPHAGHQMPAEPEPADPHAGHQMPAEPKPTDPHAGHDMGAMATEVQPGPPPPEALTGPKHAADAFWGTEGMQRGRNFLREEHGGLPAYKFFVDRAETRVRDGRDGYLLDIQAWYGGDIDKLWLKSELKGGWGRKPEHAEIQALWSHAIDPWSTFRGAFASIRDQDRTAAIWCWASRVSRPIGGRSKARSSFRTRVK